MSSVSTVESRLQNIDPYEFEEFVADLWELQGWDATATQASNDQGVDVVAQKDDGIVNQKLAIQAKRYSEGNKIGRDDVQQYYSMKVQDADADAAVVVTTSSFTTPAEEWAAEHNIKLVDAADILTVLEEENAQSLLDEYAPSLESTDLDPGAETATVSEPSPSLEDARTVEASPPMPELLANEDVQTYAGIAGILLGVVLVANPTGVEGPIGAAGVLVAIAGLLVWRIPETVWETVTPTRIVHHEFGDGGRVLETDDQVVYEPADERERVEFEGTDSTARQRAAVYGSLDTRQSGTLPETDRGTLPTQIASQGPESIAAYRYAVHEESPAQIADEMNISQSEAVNHIQTVIR